MTVTMNPLPVPSTPRNDYWSGATVRANTSGTHLAAFHLLPMPPPHNWSVSSGWTITAGCQGTTALPWHPGNAVTMVNVSATAVLQDPGDRHPLNRGGGGAGGPGAGGVAHPDDLSSGNGMEWIWTNPDSVSGNERVRGAEDTATERNGQRAEVGNDESGTSGQRQCSANN